MLCAPFDFHKSKLVVTKYIFVLFTKLGNTFCDKSFLKRNIILGIFYLVFFLLSSHNLLFKKKIIAIITWFASTGFLKVVIPLFSYYDIIYFLAQILVRLDASTRLFEEFIHLLPYY